MIDRSAAWVAQACAGQLAAGDAVDDGPRRAVVDSRVAGSGDLFFGLAGSREDGGRHAAGALERGAWGALVGPAWVGGLERFGRPVIVCEDPLRALAALARAWRRDIGARVVAITGSTGKTSTKDILAALLAQHMPVHATRENMNTEIGLPLTILEGARGTQCFVLEMAMRGAGQIAELVEIAEPDVGLITNVGPVHLELLGTVQRVAAAKAELIAGLRPGAACVVPAGEPLLAPHLRRDLATVTFGPGGDVRLVSFEDGVAEIDAGGEAVRLEVAFSEPHNLLNTVAGVAAMRSLGLTPRGPLRVRFSSLRGEVVELAAGVTVVNDCYNANPMSMRAALEHLASSGAPRTLAVLGHMAELGPESERYHREVGALADRLGIDVLVTVGRDAVAIADAFDGERYATATPEEAGALLDEIAQPGDRLLIKGSRAAGLERVLAPVPSGSAG